MGLIERLKADAACVGGALRALKMTTPIARNPTRLFPQVVSELADKYGDAPALLSDRESLSYRELVRRSNRYSRWALSHDLKKGDTVCLMMPNRPEFLALWIGITRVGGVVALLNTHLTGTALAHCINVVSPKHIIVAAELFEAMESARAHITGDAEIWLHGDADANFARIDRELDGFPATSSPRAIADRSRSRIVRSTSIRRARPACPRPPTSITIASCWRPTPSPGVMDTRASDRMYDCLPLYHTAGGLLATGALLLRGGSVVIREKFSASEFWDDIVRWECTCFQYIGELCRYLVNSPPHPQERAHRLRLACGNGLRPDVWREFKERFRIPKIIEFYAATEGNVSLFNFEGKEGAVGRLPWYVAAASRPRSSASTSSAKNRSATSAGSASNAASMRWAR